MALKLNSNIYDQMVLDTGAKIIQWVIPVFSIYDDGTRYLYEKKKKLGPLHHTKKLTQIES